MAHIEDTLAPHFTGHVGPVRFVDGHAETTDPELVGYFTGLPERYVVTDADEHPKRHRKAEDKAEGHDSED